MNPIPAFEALRSTVPETKRDPRLLLAAVVSAVLLWALAGCAHRESQRSRDILECEYNIRYVGPKLPPATEAAVLRACRE